MHLTKRKKIVATVISLLLVIATVTGLALTAVAAPITTDNKTSAGNYAYKKVITPNSDGTYDVEIAINNFKNVVNSTVTTYSPMDVVIIADCSLSMATSMSKEKSSILEIINSLYTIGSTYTPSQMPNIALVEFGGGTLGTETIDNTTSTHMGWTALTSTNYKSGGSIYNKVDSLPSRGVSSSRIDLALQRAHNLFNQKKDDGRDKFCVLFSDGDTCVSYIAVTTDQQRTDTIAKAAQIKKNTYGSSSGNKAKIYSVIIGGSSLSSSSSMSAGERTMAMVSSGCCEEKDGKVVGKLYESYSSETLYYYIDSNKNPTWFCSYNKSNGLTDTAKNSIISALKTSKTQTTTTGNKTFSKNTVILDKLTDSYFTIVGTPKAYTQKYKGDSSWDTTLTDVSLSGLTYSSSWVRVTGYDFAAKASTKTTSTTGAVTYSGERLVIKYKVKQNPNYVGNGGSYDMHLTSSNYTNTLYKPNNSYYSGIYASGSASTPAYTLGTTQATLTAVAADNLVIVYHGNGNTSGTMNNQDVILSGAKNVTLNANQFVQKRTMVFDGNGDDKYPASNSTVTKNATFLGWSSSPANAEKNIVLFKDKANIDLSSYYESGTDDFTLDLYACWGSPTVECPGASRETFDLIGWDFDKDSITAFFDEGDEVDLQNLYNTVYAVWEKQTLTITYDYLSNGGTSVSDATKVINKGDPVDLSVTAEKAKIEYNQTWQFEGWSLSANSKELVSDDYIPTEDITLYAVFKLNLPVRVMTLDKNASSKEVVINEDAYTAIYNNETSIYFTEDDTGDDCFPLAVLQTETISTKDFNEVMYIGCEKGSGDTSFTVSTTENLDKNMNMTVYSPGDSPTSYKKDMVNLKTSDMVTFYSCYNAGVSIVFDSDGGSSVKSLSANVLVIAAGNVSENQYDVVSYGKVALPSGPTKDGYTFKGWKVEGYDDVFDAGTKINVFKNTTVKAVYDVDLYAVTYNYAENGGQSVDVTTKSVVPGSSIDTTPVAVKQGWEFLGWSLDKNSIVLIKDTDKMPHEDITIYAVYKKNINADFYTLNGKETKSAKIYNKENQVTIAVPVFDDCEDKMSTGLYTDGLTSTLYSAVTLSKDGEFFAVYKTNPVIKYNSNGGDTTPESSTGSELTIWADKNKNAVIKDVSHVTLAAEITRTGYIFNGWSIDGNVDAAGSEITIDKDKTATATWTPISYTVVYDPNGASGGNVSSQSAEYDTSYKVADNSFYHDYDGSYFICWNTAPDGSGTDYYEGKTFKNLSSVDGDTVTLYARWLTATKEVEALDGAFIPGAKVKYTISYTFPTNLSDVVIYDNIPSSLVYEGSNVFSKYYEEINKNEAITESLICTIGDVDSGTTITNTALMYSKNDPDTIYETNAEGFTVSYCKISYEGSGISGETGPVPVDNSFYSAGTTSKVKESELSVPGYTFVGWENKEDGSYYAEGADITVNNNVVLTAMFAKAEKTSKCSYIAPGESVVYTINVEFPGDITSATLVDNVPDELQVISVSDKNLVISGSTVSGNISAINSKYSVVINCMIKDSVSSGDEIKNKANITFAETNKTIESNTDSIGMGYMLTYVDSNEVFSDGIYHQPSEDVVLDGAKKTVNNSCFVKWCTSEDGTGVMYDEGEEINLIADVTLYAMRVEIEKKVSDDTLQDDYVPGEKINYDIFVKVPYSIGVAELIDILPEELTLDNFYLVTDSNGSSSGGSSDSNASGNPTDPSEKDDNKGEGSPDENQSEKLFIVDPNGGYWIYEGIAHFDKVYIHSDSFDEPDAAVRLGYAFKGWNKSVNNNETTYTASWEENTEGTPFVIYIDPNGGVWSHNGVSYTEKTITDITDYSLIEDPVKDGYMFNGWTVSNEVVSNEDGQTLETTFTAIWIQKGYEEENSGPVDIGDDNNNGDEAGEGSLYKITFSASAGEIYHFVVECTVNEKAKPSTNCLEGGHDNYVVNKAELIFDGGTYESNGASIKIADYHKILYHVIELNGKTPDGDVPVDEHFYRHNEIAKVLPATSLKMEGYKFISWSTEKKIDKGTEYVADDTVTIDSDIDLYAIYSEVNDLPETGAYGIVIITAMPLLLVAAYIFVNKRKKEE